MYKFDIELQLGKFLASSRIILTYSLQWMSITDIPFKGNLKGEIIMISGLLESRDLSIQFREPLRNASFQPISATKQYLMLALLCSGSEG